MEVLNHTLKYWSPEGLSTDDASSSRVFSVLQWNTLNSELSDTVSFPKVEPLHTEWPYRSELIKKYLTAIPADFYCLEEVNPKDVEFYEGLFKPMERVVEFYPKKSGMDGLLLVYNSKKWDLVEIIKKYYQDADTGKEHTQCFMIAVFKGNETDKDYIQICLTHLKAKVEFEETRYVQVQQLTKAITTAQKEAEDKYSVKPRVVITGDFNTEPQLKSIKHVSEDLGLGSAFSDAKITTFKIRDKEYCRVIDFIFYDKELKLIERNAIPTKEEFGLTGLPNAHFPSDHYFLYAKFTY